MSFSPEEWTPKKRESFLAHSLTEFLAVVPTAGSVGQGAGAVLGAEEMKRRTAKAEQLSGLMDAVAGAEPAQEAEADAVPE